MVAQLASFALLALHAEPIDSAARFHQQSEYGGTIHAVLLRAGVHQIFVARSRRNGEGSGRLSESRAECSPVEEGGRIPGGAAGGTVAAHDAQRSRRD